MGDKCVLVDLPDGRVCKCGSTKGCATCRKCAKCYWHDWHEAERKKKLTPQDSGKEGDIQCR